MKRGELGESLNLSVEIIPEGRPNRPGTPITIRKITVHNTSNTDRGANASSHSSWVRNTGYYLYRGRKNWVSWHYTVDDREVIKQLPIAEKGWHAGSGNSQSIGIEICMHQGIDQAKAFDRAARLIAALLYDLNMSIEDVVTHKYWTGKNCPILLLDPQGWQNFTQNIQLYLSGIYESNSNAEGDDDDDV